MLNVASVLWRLPVWARRALLFGTSGLLLGLTIFEFSGGLFRGRADPPTAVLCGLFVLLAAFAALSWALRVFGFLVGTAQEKAEEDLIGIPSTRTAIVMPVFNENVERVALGLERTWLSAKASGLGAFCDCFVLSDSRDPSICAAEERSCTQLLKHFEYNRGTSGRLFLVRRIGREGYKAGNIANFLRVHGANYDFMLVLDADSAMTGERMRRLIRALEQRPRTAIVQSLMTIYRARTLFARIMQSSQNPQSALYSSGLRWLLDTDGIYWGHNALIRIRPFVEHAMLPFYPWVQPEGGSVLSQDVHEASLLGRAGWDVDIDLDEGGSYEEMPANLISNAERDRRWCQGDFLNLALIFTREIRTGQRLWLLYIFSGYFMSLPVIGIMLLGSFDACRRSGGAGVGAAWIVLLNIYLLQLVPKGLAFVRSVYRGGVANYGVVSFLLDTIGGLVFGPLMLYLHGRIIIGLLQGQALPWKSPSRSPADSLSWKDATDVFWPATVVGLLWISVLALKAPTYLMLCGPVMIVWAGSIPIAVLTSQVGIADWLARQGWMRAQFSADEMLALGPLVLDPDRTVRQQPDMSSVVSSHTEGRSGRLVAPSASEMQLGYTKLRIPLVGIASTNRSEVVTGAISAQRLLLLIGLSSVIIVGIIRYSLGK